MHTLYVREGETFKEAPLTTVLEEASHLVERLFAPEPKRRGEPKGLRTFLRLKLATSTHEVFAMVVLDANGKMLDYLEIFRGTVDGCSIYPREVVREAMQRNAASVIFAHNHPSGTPEPSQADKLVTRRLKDALAVVDIAVRDHLVIGEQGVVSFAERGLI